MLNRAYIVHGYQAAPQHHWFPWLSGKLAEHNIATHCIALPESHHPDFHRWQQTLADTIATANQHTLLIAHSLGCITLLHYLSAQRPQRLGGLLLASGFDERLPRLPELDDYIGQARIDHTAIRAATPHIYHFISDNDSIVPPALSHKLADTLGGHTDIIPQGGHLLGSDGFTELPPAWQAVQNILAAPL